MVKVDKFLSLDRNKTNFKISTITVKNLIYLNINPQI